VIVARLAGAALLATMVAEAGPAAAYCTSAQVAGLADRYRNARQEVATLKSGPPPRALDATEAGFVRDTLGDIGNDLAACASAEKNDVRALFLRVLIGYVRADQGYWDALAGSPATGRRRAQDAIVALQDTAADAEQRSAPPAVLADARAATRHGYAILAQIEAVARTGHTP
jgi:hypothetical protein